MPSVATLSGIRCIWLKDFSMASISTDSRATQNSLGRTAMRQEGSFVAIDNRAPAVDKEIGVSRSEINRFACRVNQNGPSQVRRSASWAHTRTFAGEASFLARRAANRKNPMVTAAAGRVLKAY